VGNIKACEPAAAPSIRALKIPPARAKNTIRYTIAAIVTILDVLGETEYIDKYYFKNKIININHINQSIINQLTNRLSSGWIESYTMHRNAAQRNKTDRQTDRQYGLAVLSVTLSVLERSRKFVVP
jgi:hypothetical protein